MRLEDICTVFTDGDWIESKDQSESGIRLVQTGNIGEGRYLEKEARAKYISEETFYKLKCTEIFPGDILVSRLPEPVGRACIVPEKTERMITAVDCTICRPNESLISKEYLCYFMRSNAYYTRLLGNVTGTTRKRISRKNLGSVELQIPTKDEQKIVVERLDCLVKAIDSRTKEFQLLDELIKARFVEMFYGKRYPVVKWNNVFNTTTGKLDSNAAVDDGVYPFFTCSKEALRIDKYAFDQEALLLAGNNAAGKYDVKYYNGKFNAYQRTYVLGLKENWSYRLFQYQLEDKLVFLQQQSLGGLTKYLTLKILGKLDFIIPPMDKQKEFEQFVNQVDKSKFIRHY